MRRSEQVAVVIPCLNEAGTIGSLVKDVRKQLLTVYVVDDGSTDGTAEEASRSGALVLRHESPCGKGAALKTGLSKVTKAGFLWALLMDGDGQHCPCDIAGFLAASAGAALIVGDRLSRPAGMPLVRYVVNKLMSLILSTVAREKLLDSQCGFRLVKLSSWRSLSITSSRFEIESEMLLAFISAGLPVGFVPIQVRYGDEQSKINPIIDTWRWFVWLAKWLLKTVPKSEKSVLAHESV
jgi:glycosyltransferase involved in cell wall biosynthesis